MAKTDLTGLSGGTKGRRWIWTRWAELGRSRAVNAMLQKPTCVLALVSVLGTTPGRSTAADGPHRFLFIPSADVERARLSVKTNTELAGLARELLELATTNRSEDLPPLDRTWWDTARLKPWADTYPEVFHHTWMVPSKWAQLARDCARASLLSSAPEFAEKAKAVLLGLSGYSFEFDHYDVGMNYTVWAVAALEAYDILYERFSPGERQRLDAFFDRYLAAVGKSDDYWIQHEPGGKLNNHYAWHKLGLAMIGLFYSRPELVERALRGPKGVEHMLSEGFKDDGLWLEGSIHYQLAETAPLVILAQLLENVRSPESLFRSRAATRCSLKQTYDALVPLLFPDRTLPTLGDTYGRRRRIGETPDWEMLFRQFRDPTCGWILSGLQRRNPQALFSGIAELPRSTPAPASFSRIWTEMGYVALRSNEGTNYWNGQGWSLFATSSGQPVHAHADKLSLILFANGHLWLPDCEAVPSAEHAFSSATQKFLNRETICHNTLLVDGRSQRFPGQRLDLVSFSNTPSLKQVTMGDLQGRLYEGVRQLRTLIVCPECVIDCFQVSADNAHEYMWLTHVDGRSVAASTPATRTFTWSSNEPWLYLRSPRAGPATNQLWECFSHNGDSLRMDLRADGPTTPITCGFPEQDAPAAKTIPMRLFTRQGTKAWFLALYRSAGTTAPTPGFSLAPAPGGRVVITLKTGEESREFTAPAVDELPPKPGAAQSPEPEQTDLRPLFVRWGLLPSRQGARGTCSVFTVAGAIEFAIAKKQGTTPRLSVEFLNWAANKVCGDQEDGGFFSDLWKGFSAFGICDAQLCPYRVQFDPALAPAAEALADAKTRLALGLRTNWIKNWNVNTGLEQAQLLEIKRTLSRGWPVCAGLRWPKRERWVGGVLQMAGADAVRDGHSVLLVGFRDEAAQPGGGVLVFRNTANEGQDGCMPYAYARAYVNDALWIDFEGQPKGD